MFPLVNEGNNYICITRPRRFGKTVTANMIAAFFSKAKNADDIFEKCTISQNAEYTKYQNQYSVIHISFNDLPKRCKSYEEYIERIENRLIKDICLEYPDIEISEDEAVWDILNEIYAYDINARFIFVFDERKRMNNKRKRIIKIIIPLIIAILSVFVFARFTTSTEYHAKTIQSLDEKKTTVMELTAASTAASAAITLIPGDTGTPIAEKLADLSSYFLIVLCALFLEKYLLTITGYAAFMILIPIACVLYSASEIFKRNIWKQFAYKLVLFGLGIYLIVPVSVKVSDMIETTYQTSIEQTIDSAKQTTEEIKDSSDEEESSGVSGLISKVKDGVSTTTSKIENILNDFIEALAVMIVTSCLIPILVMIFFVWIIKSMLGMDMTGWKRIERI